MKLFKYMQTDTAPTPAECQFLGKPNPQGFLCLGQVKCF